MFDRISVVGLGYIGLPTAALFAVHGTEVIGVDVSARVVDTINDGRIHIIEPDLDGVVHKVVTEGKLRATLTAEPADAFIIAVPTPFCDGYKPDLSYIENAIRTIAPVLKKGDLIILESTSPVGATEQMSQWLAEARPDISFPQSAGEGADVQVAHCPERVLPGHVLRELVENDRVIGGMTEKASKMAVDLYRRVVKGDCVITTVRTAEMCKLTENSFRDVEIAFANELSMICEKIGVDVWELISLANRHPRVNILQPGAGVGGHCIAVDPWFIVSSVPDEAKIIRAARAINDSKPVWVVEQGRRKIMELLDNCPERTMENVTVSCLGLAFKPDIDDLRESPALQITRQFARLNCRVLAVEPHIEELPESLKELGVQLIGIEEALKADIVIVLVRHSAFRGLKERFSNGANLLDFVGLEAGKS